MQPNDYPRMPNVGATMKSEPTPAEHASRNDHQGIHMALSNHENKPPEAGKSAVDGADSEESVGLLIIPKQDIAKQEIATSTSVAAVINSQNIAQDIHSFVQAQLEVERSLHIDLPFNQDTSVVSASRVGSRGHAKSVHRSHAASKDTEEAELYSTARPRSVYTYPRFDDDDAMELTGNTAAHIKQAVERERTQSVSRPLSAVQKSETGLHSDNFPGQLRSGRGLLVPAPRPEVAGSSIRSNQPQRHRLHIQRKHEAHLLEAAAALARAKAAASAPKEETLTRHMEELEKGRELLQEVDAQLVRPYIARKSDRKRAMHHTWDATVYQQLKGELESAVTSKFGVVSPQLLATSVLSCQDGHESGMVLAHSATRARLDAMDPTKRPLHRVDNETAEVGRTSYVHQLESFGAKVYPDGKYVLASDLGQVSMRPSAHDTFHFQPKPTKKLSMDNGTSATDLSMGDPLPAAPEHLLRGIAQYDISSETAQTRPRTSALRTAASTSLVQSQGKGRPLLHARVWGTGVIEDTTFAHVWPLVGDGLVGPSHPNVRVYAQEGESRLIQHKDRLFGDPARVLTKADLASTLLQEAAGYGPGYRGKRRVSPVKRSADSDALPKGRKKNPELDPKLRGATASMLLSFDQRMPMPRDRPGLRHVEMSAAAAEDHVRATFVSMAKLYESTSPIRSDVVGRKADTRVPVPEAIS